MSISILLWRNIIITQNMLMASHIQTQRVLIICQFMIKSYSRNKRNEDKIKLRILFALTTAKQRQNYRRRSSEGQCFGFMTAFQKNIYLALPNRLVNKPAEIKAPDSPYRKRKQMQKMAQSPVNKILEPISESKSSKIILKKYESIQKRDLTTLRKLSSRDQGFFRPFSNRVSARKDQQRQNMELVLLKARETAFGYKVTKSVQKKIRVRTAITRQRAPLPKNVLKTEI